jgi:ATP-dependent helicase/nuclease subunit A
MPDTSLAAALAPHADPVAVASARQREAATITRSAWVAASAGSGKTKLLTDRVVNLLLAGVTPDSILCLTYTRAAASEMAGRVAKRLADWVRLPDGDLRTALTQLGHTAPDLKTARQLFATLLDHPLGLNINTIHGFCQSLLARFPLEADLPPDFKVLEETDASELLREALHQVLAEASDDLAVALDRLAAATDDGTALKVLRSLLNDRTRLRACVARHSTGFGGALANWLEMPIDLDAGALDAVLTGSADEEALQQACALLRDKGTAKEQESATALQRWLEAPDKRLEHYPAYRNFFFTAAGEPRKKLTTKATQAATDALRAECERLLEIEQQQRALRIHEDTCALYTAALTVWQRYASLKAARGQFDFADLIEKVERLLADREETAWVLYKLDQRISHILVDEAQDTSPLQWHILSKLSEDFFSGESGREQQPTLLVVGDAKQSIYSFQGAAPELFHSQRESMQQDAAAIDHAFPTIPLDVSFRSTDVVLDLVDAVFAEPPASIGVADTAPVQHRARRAGCGGTVELWPPVTVEATPPEPWCRPTERRPGDKAETALAAQIARRVAQWLRSGDMIPESTGQPLRAEDILILLQRREPLQGLLLQALKAEGIPVMGADRLRLMAHLAVQDLVALGRFLCLPDDDLSLACALKSPLFDLSEEQLFTLCHDRPGSLWQSLQFHAKSGTESVFSAVRDQLRDLQRRAGYMTPPDLYAFVLNHGGRRQMLTRFGLEAREPLDAFEEQLQAFTSNHAPSLPRCLAWLTTADPEVKREAETEAAGVRIMTVHGSKGLEAPVVILPDTTRAAGAGNADGLLWADDEHLFAWGRADDLRGIPALATAEAARQAAAEAEKHRLLYVALTRAADRLYIGGIGRTETPPPDGSWYQLIAAGLDRLGDAVTAEPCPLFGQVRRFARRPVRPLTLETNTHTHHVAPPSLPDWLLTPAGREEKPPLESVAARENDESSLTPHDRSAALTGDLLHLLLQKLPQWPADTRAVMGRELLVATAPTLPAEQHERLLNSALTLMATPELAFLFTPPGFAEVPILGEIDGKRISGRIDRLVVTPEAVHVVDFKTTVNPPRRLEDVRRKNPAYLHQLAVYRQLLGAIYPNRPIRAWLLWTATQTLMEVPETVPADA